MKNSILIIFFLSLFTSTVSGQISTHETNFMLDKIRAVYDANILFGTGANHQVYLDDWAEGYVHSNTLNNTNYMPLRYFVYNEEFHIVTPEQDTVVLNKSCPIDSITVQNKKYIYTSYNSNKKIKNGYFEELSHGKFKLLKHYICTFEKGNEKTATGYEKIKKDRYKITSKLYFQDGEQAASLLPGNKNNILLIFDKPNLAQYIKKNKLKIRKEKDLIKLFNYYNSL